MATGKDLYRGWVHSGPFCCNSITNVVARGGVEMAWKLVLLDWLASLKSHVRANRGFTIDDTTAFEILRRSCRKSSSKHKPRTPIASYCATTTKSLPIVVRQAITALRNNLLIGPSWGFSRPPLVISSGFALPPQVQTPPPRL